MKKKLSLIGLVAATYFMVAGGPYGIEELVQRMGYRGALLVLVLTPILWSLPTALMVGELASAIPDEGGFYVWTKRAMGPFWGFQEAWLSLCASVFDMAIYPTLFLLYLGRLWPAVAQGPVAIAMGVAVLVACATFNLRGSRTVGRASQLMALLLLVPFVVMTVMAFATPAAPATPAALPVAEARGDFIGALLVAMWNFMGWDNASTVAGEVNRPQRTYPLAMLISLALVALTYVVPVAAAARSGLSPSNWTTGAWVEAGELVGGRWLALAVVGGGMLCGLGMANALVMSYSRLPLVLAQDGRLPRFFARQLAGSGAPWVSILALTVAWSAALGLGLDRLIELDVLLYGLSLLLEFAALVILRVREPELRRPFRVPGGLPVAILLGVGPALLLGLALARERGGHTERIGALSLAAALVATGPLIYLAMARGRRAD